MDALRFERVLRQRHVLALAFGAMIGWSWVLLSGTWIARAGSLGASLAFVLAGGAMLLIALTYAELAAALPQVGGEHVYAERAFGPGVAFLCTWSLLLGYVSVVAFEAVALPYALGYLFPALSAGRLWTVADHAVQASDVAIGIGSALVLTAINARGIAASASLQGYVTTFIVVAGVVLALGALNAGQASHFAPAFVDGAAGMLGVVVMVPLMFVGFDVIPQAAEEIDLPARRIGTVMVLSVVCGIAWYVTIILAVAYALPPAARSAAELATASAAAHAWSAPWAGQVLVAGGVAGILTTWNAFLVGASRLVYVMAAAGQLPAWLAPPVAGDRALRPALWAITGLTCLAPWCGRAALIWLVDAGSLGVVVAYALVALAFLALRRREPGLARPYRVPWGEGVGVLAVLLALLLILLYLPPSPSALRWPQEWLICLGWAMAGALLHRRRRGQ